MTLSSGIRSTVRTLINNLGSTAYVYSYSSATKTKNEEGDVTITAWGSPTTIKVVSSDNMQLRRLLEMQGEESDESGRSFLIRDTVTVAHRDKVTIGTDVYMIDQIKDIDPIEDTIILKKIILCRDERYT